MKKTLLILTAGVAMSFGACTSDDPGTSTSSVSTLCLNIVTRVDDGITEAKTGGYNLALDLTTQTAEMKSVGLSYAGMSMELSSTARYITSGYDIYMKDISGTVSGGTPQAMSGTFLVTPWYYPALMSSMDYLTYDLPQYPYNGVIVNIMAASYRIGNEYLVRTFQPDTFFTGITTISSDDGFGSYSDITFRLVLDASYKQAALIIYKARFTSALEENQKEAVILKDLDVAYTADGITVTGTEVVPEVVVGKVPTPDPAYTFTDIKLQVGGDILNKCAVTYTVADRYKASFNGDYIYDELLKR